jgi:urea transport system ATP-binding protein
MISIKGLSQYYGQSNILRKIDLNVPKGLCTCLMGRNGVGKTTLLKCLMGLLPIKNGKVFLRGDDITDRSAHWRARHGLGYVPQGRQIFPLLTVEENLLLPLAARRDKAGSIPESVYDLFPVLKMMRSRRGGDLSGGQQQQLAIARAMVLEPEILILDEPTEGIQPNIVAEIIDFVRRMTSQMGLTVLQVEQKVPIARKVGHNYAIMERGRMVAKGSMEGLDAVTIKSFLTV